MPSRAVVTALAVGLWTTVTTQPASLSAQSVTVAVEVEVTGLEGELATNVRAIVSLSRAGGDPMTPARARLLFDRAPDEIRSALEPFGRYSPEIVGELTEAGDRWTAAFDVDPGPPTIVTGVDYALTGEGARDSVFVALRDSLTMSAGDTLRHAPYEAAKAVFFRYARNHGYFDARFETSQIRVDRGAATAEVVFRFETGTRYLFGPVTVEQDVLDSAYVNGYVTAVEGEPFDAAELRASQVALTSGPWFGRADLELDVEGATERGDRSVPVRLRLAPSRPQRYEIAGGYGTDTGFRATLGMTLRRINRKGHYAEAELRVSQVEIGVGARYNIPRPFPSTSLYSVFGSFGDVSPTWSSTLSGTLGLSRQQQRGPLLEVVSLAWEAADYEAAGLEGSSTLVVPQVEWTWVVADDRVLATRGHRLNLRLNGAHDAVLSTATFFSARLDAKLIRPLGARMRWIARVETGHVETGNLLDLPPTRRFVAGGAQSVRGFSFESIGPGDDADLLVGGKTLLLGGLEADFEVIPRWRLAAFADAGDAVSSSGDFDAEVGAGLGIRWASPIGLIRFDFASPLTDPDTRLRIHFVFGPDL